MKLIRANLAAVSLCVFSFFALLLCLSERAEAQSRTYSDYSPIDYRVVVPCSDEEIVVLLSGTLHTTFGARQDANGGYHITSHSNWQGVTGVNEETGEVYHLLTGGSGTSNSSDGTPFTSNMVTNGAVVSAGNGIILYLHNIYHVTMNAQGEISAQFLYQTADCKNEIEPTQEQK